MSNLRKQLELRDWTAKVIARDRGLDPDITDDLNYSIGRLLYHYGSHYRYECETREPRDVRLARAFSQIDLMKQVLEVLEGDPDWAQKAMAPFAGRKVLFNNAYVQRGLGREAHSQNYKSLLEANGWVVLPPPWSDGSPATVELAVLGQALRLFEASLLLSIELTLNRDFQDMVRSLEHFLEDLYRHECIHGCILPTAEPFFERATFRIMRGLGKATMLSYHGFGGAPYPELLGSAEYALLWGERDAELLHEQGIHPDRTVVIGHPFLDSIPTRVSGIGFDDVLVLTYAQTGAPVGDMPIHQDRGELIQFTDEVARVLKRLGIRSARLRPHPSESADWYKECVDSGFYTLDEAPFDESLARCSCVIGGVSSALLDAHSAGKPYVIYVPEHLLHVNDGGWPLMPPFDGTVEGIPFASTLDELQGALREGRPSNLDFWKGYLTAPAHPERILELFEKRGNRSTLGSRGEFHPSAIQRAEAHVAGPTTPRDQAIMDASRPFTMTPPARIQALIRLVDHVCAENIPGEFVECGVWKGGSIMSAAIRLLDNRCNTRDIYLYDTFEGMSEPTENDVSPEGKRAAELLRANTKDKTNHIWAYSPLEDVKRHMDSTGYPSMRVRYVQGKVEDTIPGILPGRIALLRLDTDWYESTLHELEHMYPLLVPGGVLVLDDYGFWQGARKAVDEYFARLPQPPELHIIHDGVDDSARWCVKP